MYSLAMNIKMKIRANLDCKPISASIKHKKFYGFLTVKMFNGTLTNDSLILWYYRLFYNGDWILFKISQQMKNPKLSTYNKQVFFIKYISLHRFDRKMILHEGKRSVLLCFLKVNLVMHRNKIVYYAGLYNLQQNKTSVNKW